jgi:HAD superfamily hydrolase (TIGR01509 family)
MKYFDEAIQHFLEKNNYPHLDIKAVFFDMDGVLYDSMRAHAAAWVKSMKQYNFLFAEYDCYLNEGRTGHDTINNEAKKQWGREATEQEMQEIYALKSRYFDDCGKAVAMPSANDLLQKIKNEGRKIVLVTGSGQPSLLDNLNADFPNIFDENNTVTAFDVKYGKPNPEPYLTALQKAGVAPYEAVVVENAPLGVQAATSAGIFTIAVNTGVLEDKILYDFGANIVLSGVPELFEKWETI